MCKISLFNILEKHDLLNALVTGFAWRSSFYNLASASLLDVKLEYYKSFLAYLFTATQIVLNISLLVLNPRLEVVED